MRQSILCAGLVSLLVACAADPVGESLATSTQALTDLNGQRLNGMRLNGMRLNGMRLNGMRLNGMRLNGMRLNGSVLSGYLVVGYDKKGNEIRKQLSGGDLVGATLVGEAEDGSEITLRVDSYRTGARPDRDIAYYGLSAWDAADRAWEATCGNGADGRAIEAIPVPGVWDMSEGTPTGGSHTDSSDRFTFGCRDTAIGECVEWGYKPWLTITRCDGTGECWQVPGGDYHQTCTRLVRADYCGDGTSWTKDGTMINVYDDVGIEGRDQGAGWAHEANWTPDGASCMSGTRINLNRKPACIRERLRSACPATWSPDTLVMTDYLAR
jgi:hypothetical protein